MQTSRRPLKDTNRNLTRVLVALVCALVVTACAPSWASSEVYTVQPGDTLAKIAAANDTTVEDLVELNKDAYSSLESDPSAIEVGWKLKVPGNASGISIVSQKGPTAPTLAGSTPTQLDQEAFEAEVVRLINKEREKAGLATLEINPTLVEIARVRSQDMVEKGYFSHYGPDGKYLVMELAPKYGIDGWVWENSTQLLRTTSLTSGNAARAVSNWMNSQDHRKVLMEPFLRHTGVGIAIEENAIIVNQLFTE
jgi:uncharacterized protein YkwD